MSRHRRKPAGSRQVPVEEFFNRDNNETRSVLVVSRGGLTTLNPRPTLSFYIKQVWERRFFIVADARSKALRTTRDYRLWRLWLVANPILDVGFYWFLFGVLFKTARGVDNFVGFLIIGIIYMRMLTGLLNNGVGLISKSRPMIRAFQFPRASLAISQTLRSAMDNVLPAVVAIVLAVFSQWGEPLHLSIVFVPVLFLMIHIFGCGLTLIFARLTAKIPDVRALMPFLTQAWFFLSGVMFSIDRFSHVPHVRDFLTHNPGHLFLEAVRNTAIYGSIPSLSEWAVLCAWTFGTFFVGFFYFWRAEADYVRIA